MFITVGVIVPLGLLLIIIVIVARIGIGYKCNHSAEGNNTIGGSNNIIMPHCCVCLFLCDFTAADIPAATKPKQEDQAYRQENSMTGPIFLSPHYVMFINIIAAEFRDSEYSISEVQTLQDCGSSIPFMSQYGLPQDTSSGIHIKS